MTCPHCIHPRVTLIDGTETCTWSEAWRAECEARAVCDMGNLYRRREYLLAIDNKRGPKAGAQLRALVRAVWDHRTAQPAVANNTGSS